MCYSHNDSYTASFRWTSSSVYSSKHVDKEKRTLSFRLLSNAFTPSASKDNPSKPSVVQVHLRPPQLLFLDLRRVISMLGDYRFNEVQIQREQKTLRSKFQNPEWLCRKNKINWLRATCLVPGSPRSPRTLSCKCLAVPSRDMASKAYTDSLTGRT